MSSVTRFPGKGTPMYLASSNAEEPEWIVDANGYSSPDPVIPAGEFSLGAPVNPGMQTDINILFDGTQTTDAELEYDVDPTFANAVVLDTITASTDAVAVWTTNNRLSGFIRINNGADVDILGAWLQQTLPGNAGG